MKKLYPEFRRGLVGVIVLIILLGVGAYGAYYAFTNYTKAPNPNTQKLAKALIKYPTATTWREEPFRNFCFFSTDGCSQPIRILFETPEDWGGIYSFYMKYLTSQGWTTNSSIVTSLPSSIIFVRPKDNCKITFENHGDIKYSAIVVCPEKSS